MKFTKIITVVTALSAALVIAANPAGERIVAEASTAKSSEALAAYRIMLEEQAVVAKVCSYYVESVKDIEFALTDLNQDGTQEMVLTADEGYHTSLVAFVDGRAKEVGGGFSGEQKYYPNKQLYFSLNLHSGSCYQTYYTFDGQSLKELAEKHGSAYENVLTGEAKDVEAAYQSEDPYAPFVCSVNGKNVTEDEYNEYEKKLLTGAKEKELSFVKNTDTNRNAYLMDSAVSASKRASITKFINGIEYLDYYAAVGGYTKRKTLSGKALKTDMALYRYYLSRNNFKRDEKKFGEDSKYPTYGGRALRLNSASKKAVKKSGKKLFGSGFSLKYTRYNKKKGYDGKALFYQSADKKYILDWCGNHGDYYAPGAVTSITKKKGIYTVKYMGQQMSGMGVEDFSSRGSYTYTLKLKKSGKSYVIRSVSYSEKKMRLL